MELRSGDWVKTETGDTGKVVHISRLTVFVELLASGKDYTVKAYLESQLTKIDPSDIEP